MTVHATGSVAHVECFHAAQVVLGIYRDDCNKQRPHSSLGQRTPAEFSAGTTINADSTEAPKRVA